MAVLQVKPVSSFRSIIECILVMLLFAQSAHSIHHSFQSDDEYKANPVADSWKEFAYKLRNSDQRLMLEKIETSDFNICEIGKEWERAPVGIKAQVLHTLLRLYIKHFYSWKSLLDNQTLQQNHDFQKMFSVYVTGKDPVLIPSIARLHHLVMNHSVELFKHEREYIDLSFQWIDEVLFESKIVKPLNWFDEYDMLEKSAKAWGEIPEDLIKAAEEEISSVMFSERGRRGNKTLEFDRQLPMETAWETCRFMGDCSMLTVLDDPLAGHLAGFVFQAVAFSDHYSRQEKKQIFVWLLKVAMNNDSGVSVSDRGWLVRLRPFLFHSSLVFRHPCRGNGMREHVPSASNHSTVSEASSAGRLVIPLTVGELKMVDVSTVLKQAQDDFDARKNGSPVREKMGASRAIAFDQFIRDIKANIAHSAMNYTVKSSIKPREVSAMTGRSMNNQAQALLLQEGEQLIQLQDRRSLNNHTFVDGVSYSDDEMRKKLMVLSHEISLEYSTAAKMRHRAPRSVLNRAGYSSPYSFVSDQKSLQYDRYLTLRRDPVFQDSIK